MMNKKMYLEEVNKLQEELGWYMLCYDCNDEINDCTFDYVRYLKELTELKLKYITEDGVKRIKEVVDMNLEDDYKVSCCNCWLMNECELCYEMDDVDEEEYEGMIKIVDMIKE